MPHPLAGRSPTRARTSTAVGRFVLSLAAVATASCGDSTGPGTSGPPGLTIVAGSGITDTAMAVLPQALVVELRDGRGRGVANAEIRFSGVPTLDPARPTQLSLYVRRLESSQFFREVVDTTDRAGRASVQVVLGTIAGSAWLAVRVPSTGAADTAAFTIVPGNATRVIASVVDTTLTAGGTFRLGARVTDRWGNPRDDAPIAFAAGGQGLSVDAAGNVSTAVPTRGFVVASAAALVDTAWVSVVPAATFAAVLQESNGFSLVKLALDGTGLTRLTPVRANPSRPSWHPDGQRLVFEDIDPADSRTHLFVIDGQGQRRRAIAPVPDLYMEWNGRFSADAQWLYFDGFDESSGYHTSWRARADGSAAAKLPLPPGVDETGQPDPSPDGTNVAVSGIAVQDVAGTRITRLPAFGIYPRYSRDGTRLLFSSQVRSLSVVNVDGTGARELVSDHPYDPSIPPSWSADGNFILVRGPQRLELVRVSTGEIIPLAYSASLYQPALRW